MHFVFFTHERSWVVHDLYIFVAGAGRRTYLLPHARTSSRREYDPDGSSGDGPLSGVQFMEFSQFSRRYRGGVSGFTVIFLDRNGRVWEYNKVVGRRSVWTGETRRLRTSTIRKNYNDHSLDA
ncbi:hypothetical protein EVAR_27230_1 [Eumeta japonica]|uniref:Uncharacterized protein n=1 Tax=Eumeta variegata TaxID=151549 RepID=A0A4C1VYG6_EUMVA|nr:hypothetical protein EVAR_27230_1 [Eumeta japonica]